MKITDNAQLTKPALLKCFTCKEYKEPTNFYRDASRKSGRACRCKPCDKIRSLNRPTREGRKDEKRLRAKDALNTAVKSGRLSRWPCCAVPHCNDASKPEAHHPDYDQPLSVVWLCSAHHREIHCEARGLEVSRKAP